MTLHLPSSPVIHWRSPVDSQTLGSTELEVLGTLPGDVSRIIPEHLGLCVTKDRETRRITTMAELIKPHPQEK